MLAIAASGCTAGRHVEPLAVPPSVRYSAPGAMVASVQTVAPGEKATDGSAVRAGTAGQSGHGITGISGLPDERRHGEVAMNDSQGGDDRGFAGGVTAIDVGPGMQAFLHAVAADGGPPVYALTPDAAPKVPGWTDIGPARVPAADIDERTIPAGPMGSTRIVVVRPHGIKARLPVVMYFHGTDWILGGLDMYLQVGRNIAHGAQAAVVLVDYHRLLGRDYPVAFDEAYDATRYVAEHADEFNVDATRLAIAGDGVGGNMVAAISLLAEERNGPPIRFRLLFYGVTGDGYEKRPRNELARGRWLTNYITKWYRPLRDSLEQLEQRAPALIIIDDNDVLPDQGEVDSRTLALPGVTVRAVRSLGDAHDFVVLNGLSDTPATRSAIALANAILHQELSA